MAKIAIFSRFTDIVLIVDVLAPIRGVATTFTTLFFSFTLYLPGVDNVDPVFRKIFHIAGSHTGAP